jgi:hypothetical protein
MAATLRGGVSLQIHGAFISCQVGLKHARKVFSDQGVDSDFKARIIRLLAAMNASGQAVSV